MEKRKPGRPISRSDQLRSESLLVRLDPKEKLGFKMAAGSAGLALSSWVRERLRQAAKGELEDSGQSIPFLPSAE